MCLIILGFLNNSATFGSPQASLPVVIVPTFSLKSLLKNATKRPQGRVRDHSPEDFVLVGYFGNESPPHLGTSLGCYCSVGGGKKEKERTCNNKIRLEFNYLLFGLSDRESRRKKLIEHVNPSGTSTRH